MAFIKQIIVVRKDLNMRKGKIAAQVAHASMKFLLVKNVSEKSDELRIALSPAEAAWINGPFTKIVVSVDSEQELKELIEKAETMGVLCQSIVDNGQTEFHGIPTLTCAAFGPAESSALAAITGGLKLL